MRLIDADALSEKLCETTIFIKDGEVFQRMINDAPTVSAEAEWIPREHFDVLKKNHDMLAGLLEEAKARAIGAWIPCSERLPNKEGLYLITSETGAVTTAHWYMPSEWKPNGFWGRVGKKKTVAWMPLPEPYREDGER